MRQLILYQNPPFSDIPRIIEPGSCISWLYDFLTPFFDGLEKVFFRKGKQNWQKLMIARRRKMRILCWACHRPLYAGILPDQPTHRKRQKQGFSTVCPDKA